MIHPFSRIHLKLMPTALFVTAGVLSTPAFAAGSNMPWEQPRGCRSSLR